MTHVPAAVTATAPVVAFTVHGPAAGAEKVTGRLELDVAVTENALPYCRFPLNTWIGEIVCDCRLEPCGSTTNVPDTGVAATY